MVEQGRRRREWEHGRHELLLRGHDSECLGAHDDPRGRRLEAAGRAILTEPMREVHAGPPRSGAGDLVVTERKAMAVDNTLHIVVVTLVDLDLKEIYQCDLRKKVVIAKMSSSNS